MIELFIALMAGTLLGILFYAGLWFTVKEGTTAKFPAVWFLSSFLLRTGIVLYGLYFVGGNHWQRIIAALAGLIAARVAVTAFTKRKDLSHENHS